MTDFAGWSGSVQAGPKEVIRRDLLLGHDRLVVEGFSAAIASSFGSSNLTFSFLLDDDEDDTQQHGSHRKLLLVELVDPTSFPHSKNAVPTMHFSGSRAAQAFHS